MSTQKVVQSAQSARAPWQSLHLSACDVRVTNVDADFMYPPLPAHSAARLCTTMKNGTGKFSYKTNNYIQHFYSNYKTGAIYFVALICYYILFRNVGSRKFYWWRLG